MGRKSERLSAETRARVEQELLRGRPPGDVARSLGIDGRQAAGILRKLQVTGNAAPANPAAGAGSSGTPQDAEGVDPVALGYQPAGMGGTPAAAGLAHVPRSTFTVDRTNPPHGLLGCYSRVLSAEELGRTFGAGTYRCTFRTGRRVEEYELVVSEAYGPPKTPDPATGADSRMAAIQAFRSMPFGPFGSDPAMSHGALQFVATQQRSQEELFRRFQSEADSRHSRDLERIRAEGEVRERETSRYNETMMELYTRKLTLQEEALAGQRESMREEFKSRREFLESSLELRREILRLEGEKSKTQPDWERLLSQVTRAISEERRAARELAATTGPGNVTTIPEKRQAAEPPPEATSEPEDFVAELMNDRSGRLIVSEWARQVAAQVPPGSFLGFFMDGYQDPVDHAFRKQCRVFSVYIRTRDWKTMFVALEPHLADDEKKAFASEWAAQFYEDFRACLFEEVDGYWKQVAERNASRVAAGEAEANGDRIEPIKDVNAK